MPACPVFHSARRSGTGDLVHAPSIVFRAPRPYDVMPVEINILCILHQFYTRRENNVYSVSGH